MAYFPLDNVKTFIITKPPCVIFVTSIFAFAVTTFSLALYVQYATELENPDVTAGWNSFLKHFSSMDFCISPSPDLETSKGTTLDPVTRVVDDIDKSVRSHSFQVLIDIPHAELDFFENGTLLHGNLNGGHFNLADFDETTDVMNVEFHFPPRQRPVCQMGGACKLRACVLFEGPPRLFPSNTNPSSCMVTGSGTRSVQPNDTTYLAFNEPNSTKYLTPLPSSSEKSSWHTESSPSSKSLATSSQPSGLTSRTPGARHRLEIRHGARNIVADALSSRFCERGKLVSVEYRKDPHLTVLLTVEDRSAMNLHLMHTSYFLFVCFVTLLGWAAVRGSRHAAAKVLGTSAAAADRVV